MKKNFLFIFKFPIHNFIAVKFFKEEGGGGLIKHRPFLHPLPVFCTLDLCFCTLYLCFCTLYLCFRTLYLSFCTHYLCFCTIYLRFCTLYLCFCTLYLCFCTLYLCFRTLYRCFFSKTDSFRFSALKSLLLRSLKIE